MASATGYKTERWGVDGNATPNTNQPLGTSVAVAGGALAVIDVTTKKLKDAAGSLGSNDICLGLIHTNRSSVSPSTDTNAEIETGSFFLPFDVSPIQSNVGHDRLHQRRAAGQPLLAGHASGGRSAGLHRS